ncbi:carboxylic ester hydrolase [Favolaschia claudopus]|uniref:Carboxylic ester hydrolase n=1 Tax=Favolaschia claudopus TaxID=2862362 RepID=A0AAW0CUV2_9AGAR
MALWPLTFLLLQATTAFAAAPTVRLDFATVTGLNNGTVNKFLGIPYARSPVGNLRLRLAEPIPAYIKNFAATAYGPVCPQMKQELVLPDWVPEIVHLEMDGVSAPVPVPQSEDCLTVNVIAPANATPHSKLPVLVWIYGGGFEIGYPSSTDGATLVQQSIALGTPVVYVSLNYRVNALGFLASKEVKAAGLGNLGLQDQRQVFRWVQRYVAQFGGDPRKVTIWGESAGAISVASHLLTNKANPDGLFRAAIMDSGSPLYVGDITHGQPSYDFIVKEVGCARARDTLGCLRTVPLAALMNATNQLPNMFSYQSLAEAFIVRVDGIFLTDNPQQLVKKGQVANVPFINGVNDDEGTLFSFTALNLSNTEQLVDYWKTFYFPRASTAELTAIFNLYPSDPAAGSPFDTGEASALTGQFKRYAAFMGDFVFHAPHRFFFGEVSDKRKAWSYLYKRGKALPYLGAFHSTELANAYGAGDLGARFIRFTATLDPNFPDSSNSTSSNLFWPRYTTKSPQLLTFLDGDVPQTLTKDDYRAEAIEALTQLELKYPY